MEIYAMVCFERSFQFTFLTYYNKKSGDKRVYIKDFPLFSRIFEQKKAPCHNYSSKVQTNINEDVLPTPEQGTEISDDDAQDIPSA